MKKGSILLTSSAFILAIAGTFAGKPKAVKTSLVTGWYHPTAISQCVQPQVECTTTGNGQVCKYDPGTGAPKITLTSTRVEFQDCTQHALFTLNPQ